MVNRMKYKTISRLCCMSKEDNIISLKGFQSESELLQKNDIKVRSKKYIEDAFAKLNYPLTEEDQKD